jgi:hypothetical protein
MICIMEKNKAFFIISFGRASLTDKVMHLTHVFVCMAELHDHSIHFSQTNWDKMLGKKADT